MSNSRPAPPVHVARGDLKHSYCITGHLKELNLIFQNDTDNLTTYIDELPSSFLAR